MEIQKASEIITPKICGLVYASPGSGKTVSLALMPTKWHKRKVCCRIQYIV